MVSCHSLCYRILQMKKKINKTERSDKGAAGFYLNGETHTQSLNFHQKKIREASPVHF